MKQEKLKRGSFYRVYRFETAYKKCLESCQEATMPLNTMITDGSHTINMISKVAWDEMFKSPVKFFAISSESGNAVCTTAYGGIIHEIYLPPCVIWKEVTEE